MPAIQVTLTLCKEFAWAAQRGSTRPLSLRARNLRARFAQRFRAPRKCPLSTMVFPRYRRVPAIRATRALTVAHASLAGWASTRLQQARQRALPAAQTCTPSEQGPTAAVCSVSHVLQGLEPELKQSMALPIAPAWLVTTGATRQTAFSAPRAPAAPTKACWGPKTSAPSAR